MTQNRLRQQVKEITGYEPTHSQITYAIKQGHVSKPVFRGTWYDYDETHVKQMVEFVRNRSHKYMEEGHIGQIRTDQCGISGTR